MVVTATETPSQAEVIFLVEATAANGAYISELKTNYIIPTLEYFHGGPIEEGGGNGTVYGIVAYKSSDCHPGNPISAFGPLTCPQKVVETIDKLPFIGGRSEMRACVTEAISTALNCFEEMARTDVPKHILLLCCSPPYSAYAGGIVPPGVPATIEQAARLANEKSVHLSVLSAKRSPALLTLYEHAGGDLHAAQQKNYAKDPRHLVLLKGYSLKERPPSPAPPPAPDVQTDMFGRTVGVGNRFPFPAPPRWPPRPPSALLSQLSQPTPTTYANHTATNPPGPSMQQQQQHPPQQATLQVPSTAVGPRMPLPGAAPAQRTFIWSGILEWMEKVKGPGDQKLTRHLPCQVTSNSKDCEPELKVDTWPNKLLMQLMPKQLISSIGGQYLRDSKSVLFHFQHNEALEALTKVLVGGFAGCVHFSPMASPPQCDIKVLILLYTADKNAYLGFIPNNQTNFVERLKKVIQQQKITQIINKQIPGGGSPNTMTPNVMGNTMAAGSMPGTSGMGVGNAGQSVPSPVNQPMPSNNMAPAQMQHQQQQQGMMMSNVAQKPRQPGNLDGLEAARQQNLEKILQLQQTLDAAHQQEAQFKTQMDIMSQLHAAQQQDHHYKQLEEQQRKHQMQQQLQQQLRGPAAPTHPPRIMRPIMPSNPGLRHLLQQQPQYRPGNPGVRPPSQNQQFDDVSNYSDFL